jgi:DNA processing protein
MVQTNKVHQKTGSDHLVHLLMLNRVTNLSPGEKCTVYRELGAFWSCRPGKVKDLIKRDLRVNGKPLDVRELEKQVSQELVYCSNHGVHVVPVDDPAYPEMLANIFDPPLVLFAVGRVELLKNAAAAAVVGSRKPSNFSINLAYAIARDLAEAGLTVVSGLASGIDCYAHRGALDAEGDTIAVLGNGIDRVYPLENRKLFGRVSERGLLVSELPVGARPMKHHFPMRNRIISGLCAGTVVIEAAARSGALITAGLAMEQGRDVMAVPGKAGSDAFSGNHKLICDGASLVQNAADVGRILGIDVETRIDTGKKLSFSDMERDILGVIGDDRVRIDVISRQISEPVNRVVSTLTLLELKGAVMQYPGKFYARVDTHE